MFNSSRTQVGPLATEDGTVSAEQLPFDKTTSKRAYETATFGVG
ncbi:MAG: hypothetical protein P1U58_06945 [Verrucomicrobiales bacterium]|nr:hypothetical protein [Verrucomicrobiales bacterium]